MDNCETFGKALENDESERLRNENYKPKADRCSLQQSIIEISATLTRKNKQCQEHEHNIQSLEERIRMLEKTNSNSKTEVSRQSKAEIERLREKLNLAEVENNALKQQNNKLLREKELYQAHLEAGSRLLDQGASLEVVGGLKRSHDARCDSSTSVVECTPTPQNKRKRSDKETSQGESFCQSESEGPGTPTLNVARDGFSCVESDLLDGYAANGGGESTSSLNAPNVNGQNNFDGSASEADDQNEEMVEDC